MSRLIDADALMDNLNGMMAVSPTGYIHGDTVADMISDAPTIEQPHWTPCSEKLPNEETDVLVTRKFLGCKDGSHGWNNHIPPTIYVEVAQYFNGEWTALSDEYKVSRRRHTDPIAWMPLPEHIRRVNENDEMGGREKRVHMQ